MATEHTITSYKFNELSDEAKEKARDWHRQGALDYDWFESVYEDAENVGLKITAFDLGRSQRLDAKFIDSAIDTARAIVKDHGESTDTHTLALAFLDSIDDEPTDEQERDFLRDLQSEYWSALNREAEYLLSDENVDESIEANEYDFTADGNRFAY